MNSSKLSNMGKLAEIKTKQTSANVKDYLTTVENKQKQIDSHTILNLMSLATKEEPKIWGSSIIGFGNVRIKSPTTEREVDWFRVGFSPRKANITIYLGTDISPHMEALKKLGKHKAGRGCLYINKLGDVDMKILKEIIEAALKNV